MENDYIVQGLSEQKIIDFANHLRLKLGAGDVPYVDCMELLERGLDLRGNVVTLAVGTLSEMQGAEGLTSSNGDYIQLREDVYQNAWDGQGRARFTVAHELGHWLIHSSQELGFRRDRRMIRAFESAEWQADTFAAHFLMPKKFINKTDNIEDISRRFGVSHQAAERRLKTYHKKGL